MAAALDRKGKGSITTIDRETAREREPNIETLLRQIGLEHWVEPLFAATSYNWELMRILERQKLGEQITPCFDFCFIDGAHSWETDALAFVLVDKLLRPDRWIIFDDVNWTYATSVALRDTERVRRLPEDERNTAQVKKIVDLLVRTHPDYADVRIVGGYGLVYKGGTGEEVHRGDLDRLVRSHGALFRELAFAHLRQSKA